MTEVTRQFLKEQVQWLEHQLGTAREELVQFEKHITRQHALVDRLEREIRDVRTDLSVMAEVA